MKKYLFSFLVISLLLACESSDVQVNQDDSIDSLIEEVTAKRIEKAQKVFQTLPSPIETASIFHNTGTNYNGEFLNPVENVNNYSTSVQKALNFGVYGADLSYVNLFDQSQESMFYMNCTKILADNLGITSAFSAEIMERIEENINDRDSLMTLINDAFWITDAYLKENGQDNLSALIVAGGWIEGLYLGTKTINKEEPNKELMKNIAEQKFSLSNLVGLLDAYDDNEVKQIAGKIQGLNVIYQNVKEEEEDVIVDNNEKITTIKGGSVLSYEESTIFEIIDEIEKIRNEIIQ